MWFLSHFWHNPRCRPRFRDPSWVTKKIKKARLWFGGKKSRISITSGTWWLFSIQPDAKTSFCNDIGLISVEKANHATQWPKYRWEYTPRSIWGHGVEAGRDGSTAVAIMAERMAENERWKRDKSIRIRMLLKYSPYHRRVVRHWIQFAMKFFSQSINPTNLPCRTKLSSWWTVVNAERGAFSAQEARSLKLTMFVLSYHLLVYCCRVDACITISWTKEDDVTKELFLSCQ